MATLAKKLGERRKMSKKDGCSYEAVPCQMYCFNLVKPESAVGNELSMVMKQEQLAEILPVKKKRDRFNGLTEDEVLAKLLPDHLDFNLDIVIIGINPGLTAAHVGHHYAGPGNHFWKCLFLSGLIAEPMNAYDDYKLKEFGIGFTNIVSRTSRGSADLSRREIKEGAAILTEKIQKYKPKIAVFNGKGIYEVFCGHKNFFIGKQPEPFPGTNTAIFVMPSSSARCSQLPRAVDKVPFYAALKKLRDHMRGCLPDFDENDVIFPDLELKVEPKKERVDNSDADVKPDITGALAKPASKGRKRKTAAPNNVVVGDNSASVGQCSLAAVGNTELSYVASVKQEKQSDIVTGTPDLQFQPAVNGRKKGRKSRGQGEPVSTLASALSAVEAVDARYDAAAAAVLSGFCTPSSQTNNVFHSATFNAIANGSGFPGQGAVLHDAGVKEEAPFDDVQYGCMPRALTDWQRLY